MSATLAFFKPPCVLEYGTQFIYEITTKYEEKVQHKVRIPLTETLDSVVCVHGFLVR